MGLYRRPDSVFWWMTLEGTGRKQESTGIKADAVSAQLRKLNREAAEAIYHARMTQLARARVGLPIDSAETFQAFSVWYETHHTIKHKSKAREAVILAHLRAFFGRLRLTEITASRWSEYETKRRKDGVSANTVGRELAVMKSVLSAALGVHLDAHPLAHVKRRTEHLPAKRTVTKTEETAFLKELHDEEIRDIYLVAVGTLLRQHNVIDLKRSHHQKNRLALTTKTGPHIVPLDGPTILQRRAAAVLKRRMPKSHHGYFFPRWQALFAKNRDSGNAFFLKIVRRAAKRAGLPWGLQAHGVVWHTMTRASGATRMMREHGVDLRTVQMIGGWRSLDQMAQYLGIDLEVFGELSTGRKPSRPKLRLAVSR